MNRRGVDVEDREASGLSGPGVLIHDVIYRGADGMEHRDTSRWAVQLVPISCERVPLVESHGGRLRERDPGANEGRSRVLSEIHPANPTQRRLACTGTWTS